MARGTFLNKLRIKPDPEETGKPLVITDASGNTVFDVERGGFGALRYAEVTLTNAQIKALRATPVTLVAAPGAGRILEFIAAVFLLDYGSNALTETADNLQVKYNNGSGAAASETIEMTGFIDQTADTMTTARAKVDVIVAKSGCENQALVLHNTGDGEFGGNAGNDTTMRVKVAYRVHQTGW